jgi:hypothetical protein
MRRNGDCQGARKGSILALHADLMEKVMSIFGKIASAIFGHSTTTSGATGTSSNLGTASVPGSSTGAKPTPITRAEVEAMVSKRVANQSEDLDWRRSIVDLMKALDLDSSLSARKQLAQELGYTGALDGSAQMNVWLHQQVMTKLAESGGKVPDSMKA